MHQPGLGDVGAAALGAHEQPLDDELGDRLPHGGARGGELLGQLALGGQRRARLARVDQAAQLLLHEPVLRHSLVVRCAVITLHPLPRRIGLCQYTTTQMV